MKSSERQSVKPDRWPPDTWLAGCPIPPGLGSLSAPGPFSLPGQSLPLQGQTSRKAPIPFATPPAQTGGEHGLLARKLGCAAPVPGQHTVTSSLAEPKVTSSARERIAHPGADDHIDAVGLFLTIDIRRKRYEFLDRQTQQIYSGAILDSAADELPSVTLGDYYQDYQVDLFRRRGTGLDWDLVSIRPVSIPA